jgi:hypothetical protein
MSKRSRFLKGSSAPALAGWVIHSAIYEESVPASTGIRTGDEWAESIARAMDCWRDAMGLASATTVYRISEPAAIGTRVAGSMLTYGWSRRSGRTQRSQRAHGGSTRVRLARIG